MNALGVIVKPLKNGRWKVYVWGTTDEHFDDWRGPNGRIRVAPDQPYRGYDTADEAVASAHARFPDMQSIREWGRTQRNGASMPDSAWSNAIDVDTPQHSKIAAAAKPSWEETP